MAKRHQVKMLQAVNRLAAADATKAIVAAPGAGKRLRIFSFLATVLTAAAQAVEIGHDGGGVTKQLAVMAASTSAPVRFDSDEGWPMDANTAFSVKPAAAGPAVQVYVEYTIEEVQA